LYIVAPPIHGIPNLSQMSSATDHNRRRSRRPFSGISNTNSAKLSEAASDATTSEDAAKAPWRSLFFFTTKSNQPTLITGILFSVMAGAAPPINAWIQGKIFESFSLLGAGQLTGEELYNGDRKYVLFFVGLAAATWVVNAGESSCWMTFGELQAKGARDRLFHGLLEKEIEWYDLRKHGIGALLPRLQVQIRELQLATSQPLGGLFQLVSTLVLSLAQAFYFSWDLTLVTISSVPVIMSGVIWIGRPIQNALTNQQSRLTEAQKYLRSTFSAIETVKCFNGQEIELGKYIKKVKEAASWYFRVANIHAIQMGFLVFLASTIFVQGFFYGGILIDKQKKTTADVMTCFLSAIAAFQAVQGILPNMIVLEKGRAAGSTLRMVMAEVQGGAAVKTNSAHLERPAECKGDIDVRNLSFAYPTRPNQLALDNISMSIPSGEITYLIGKSGSGKSTLSQLLLRFYSSPEGSIAVDGVPLDDLDVGWLRSNTTLVEQTSLLFNDTVFKNVAFGRHDLDNVTKDEVMEAIEFALLQLMITDMPEGLDTMVGYKGGAMSGGQRQRMALARARIRDTPILILDESTSALDHISRTLMMDAIRRWRQGKTTIIITHDISQILADDYVFVLEQGRLVQEGFRRHMEQIKDSPFQAFLPPGQRATDSPPDTGTFTTFESVYTRGSSIDFASIMSFDSPTVDPFEAQLTAMEAKRSSYMPQVFAEGGPVIVMRAAGNTGPTSAFASPFMRMAVNPPTLPTLITRWEPTAPGSRDSTPLTSPASDHTPTQRMSVILENLIDRAGKQAADARFAPGKPRRRRPVHDDASSTATEAKTKLLEKEEETNSADKVRQQSFKEILRTIWPNLTVVERCVMIAGFLGAAVHAAATPTFAYVFSKLLATYSIRENRTQKTLMYSMAMLGIAAIDGLFVYCFRYLLEYAGQRWVDSIREKAMIRILDQPREFFDRDMNSVSRMTEGLDRNAEEMKNILGRFLGMIFSAAMMATIAIAWSIAAQWKFALICMSAGPYVYLVTNAFAVVSGRWETISTDAAEASSTIMNETFINIRTVMALTLEDHFMNKYTVATEYALKVGFIRAILSGFFYGLSESAGTFSTALIFYVGTILARNSGPAAVPGLLQVCAMLVFTIANVSALLAYVPQIGQAKDTASRLLRLAQLPKDSHEHLGNTKLNTIGDIVFNNLNFSYPSRPDVVTLKDINLCIKPGTSTAIVGGSGSGKSTIANLLLNLYTTNNAQLNTFQSSSFISIKPKLGDLTLAGRDIKNVDTPSLRSLVVVVPQTPTIFAATAAANISYGLAPKSPYNTPDSIAAAARAAGIHTFIASLPSGYATLIGEGGLGLSGGQAQRIAIARALVRQPSVLILDEATSALDVESANLVRDTLKQLLESRVREMTVIIITHSREQMEIAERIVVLDQGCVVEEGAFEELLEANGALANLLSGGEWDGEGEEEKKRQGAPSGRARMRAARGRLGLRDVEWRARRGRNRLRM
jgi:ATP-binding cassette subfamily B (MDR/TAP) protein 1